MFETVYSCVCVFFLRRHKCKAQRYGNTLIFLTSCQEMMHSRQMPFWGDIPPEMYCFLPCLLKQCLMKKIEICLHDIGSSWRIFIMILPSDTALSWGYIKICSPAWPCMKLIQTPFFFLKVYVCYSSPPAMCLLLENQSSLFADSDWKLCLLELCLK